MPDVTIPVRPVLKTIPNVELIKTGQWEISTGTWNPTSDDLYAAVAAVEAPAVRRPVLKLGHSDARFDGEPAIGWVDNLRVTDDGTTLLGDFKGVPEWLADILASAFPDRSIEGEYDFVDQTGHRHPFVLTAVALLGVTAPGVGTLQSLHDIAALYGVEAAAGSRGAFRIPITAKGEPMPNSVMVAASVSVEDVRRSFYTTVVPEDAWWWIEDIYADPLFVVVIDEEDGSLLRFDVTIGEDGSITWGEATPVKREYVAASGAKRVASWSNAKASRGRAAAAVDTGTADTGTGDGATTTSTEGENAVDFTDEQITAILEALGLDDTADAAAVVTAIEELAAAAAEADNGGDTGVAARAGTIRVDAAALTQLREQAALGVAAHARQQREDRERTVDAAVKAGKIPPARRGHWIAQLEADPGAAEVLASMPDNLIPVHEIGHSLDVSASAEQDVTKSDAYRNWK
ncbi:phage protease [Rhodococcus pyridinivorans]|uniref:phage protease n=1 Tax=Rhodococcus pyridinivorans TaxID=103816 RepID=UPI000BA26B74|nr:hypothetical protein [Rhodococcus pyridinivorans]